MVEAFVNSGGNAILRTADGNIISSGVGAGLMGYGSSSAGVMGTNIVVGSRGQVSTYSSFLGMSLLRIRGVAAGGVSRSGGRVYVGRSEGYVNVRVIKNSRQTSKYVVISSAGGGTAVGSGTGGSGTSVEGGGNVVTGGTGGIGAGGVTGGVTGSGSSGDASGSGGASTVLGSTSSLSPYGKLSAYGSGISSWTIGGATTDGTGEIEVIGDFGGE